MILIAERGIQVVGLISAHVDELWGQMAEEQGGGPATDHCGLFELLDQETALRLLDAAGIG